jgi:hypothetical protein
MLYILKWILNALDTNVAKALLFNYIKGALAGVK